MHPVLLRFGSITLYSYGVMVAIGFVVAVFSAAARARSFGLERNVVIDLATHVLLISIVGARLAYVALHFDYYRSHGIEIFLLNRGGLVFYGGFLAGLMSTFFYIRWKKLSFLMVADLLSPFAALGHAIGRIGCFLNGCCAGKAAPEGLWLAVRFPGDGVFRYPTQLYSSMALFVLFIALLWKQKRRRFAGETFLLYCVSYSLFRFFIEFFRDEPVWLVGLTVAQFTSLAIFAAALALYIKIQKQCARSPSP